MRLRVIIFSLFVHAAVFGMALYSGKVTEKRKATALAVDSEKKKPPEKKPDKPTPPPPKPRAARVEPPAPTLAPPPQEPAAPKPRSSTPIAGELTNSGTGGGGGGGKGDGSGNGTGGGGGGGGSGSGKGGGPSTARAKPPEPRLAGEEAPCTEQPTKPGVSARSREIEYTQDARANGVEGRLVLKVIIGADGAVNDVIVVSSVDPSLDAAAIAAVKSWVFKPSTRCGKPMGGGVYMLAQRFELGD